MPGKRSWRRQLLGIPGDDAKSSSSSNVTETGPESTGSSDTLSLVTPVASTAHRGRFKSVKSTVTGLLEPVKSALRSRSRSKSAGSTDTPCSSIPVTSTPRPVNSANNQSTVAEANRPQSAQLTDISRSSTAIESTPRPENSATNEFTVAEENGPESSRLADTHSPSTAIPSLVVTALTIEKPNVQRDLWQEAEDALSTDEKKWIRETTSGNIPANMGDTADQMIELAEQGKRKCEAAEASRSRHWSNIIIWLNKLKEIGDSIVQYDPVHAALPWALARFTLMAVISIQEQWDSIVSFMEKVARIIHRCQIFEKLYNGRTMDPADVSGLESALIGLYTLVLRGLFETNRVLTKGTLGQSLYAVARPSLGSDLLIKIDESEAQVDREYSACEVMRRSEMDTKLQGQLRGLLQLESPILRLDENVKNVLQKMDKEELARILSWTSNVQHRGHHNTVRERRTADTCDWLIHRYEFLQWSNATASTILWLQGFPGAGKTFLTSRSIDYIETVLEQYQNDEGFAFFYCNRNEDDRRETLSILRSYAKQLSTVSQRLVDTVHPQLKDMYEKSRTQGLGWSLGLCQEYLIQLLNLYPRTTLVLDALDECKPDERTSLLDFFDSIPSNCSKPVKIMISSRPEGDIRQRLSHLSTIEIQATDNKDDIAKYVQQEIEKNGRWTNVLMRNPSLKNEIVETMRIKSDGMFQWVMLQMKELLNYRTEHTIRDRLGKLPIGLNAAYDEIYNKINELPERDLTISIRALQWIMCAYKPLTTQQLLAAVHLNPDDEIVECFYTSDESAFENDLLDFCANFIRRDPQYEDFVWRFSHLSVVEYLEEHHFTVPQAHCFVSRACLVLLLNLDEVKQGTARKDDIFYSEHQVQKYLRSDCIFNPKHELQKYVLFDWIRHVHTQDHQDPNPELVKLLKAFLGSFGEPSVQYRTWFSIARYTFQQTRFSDITLFRLFHGFDENRTEPIFLASFRPLYYLLRDWWDGCAVAPGVFLNSDKSIELLCGAVLGRNTSICTKLCDWGRDVYTACHLNAALVRAAEAGYKEVATLLLDRGADVNLMSDECDGIALVAAAREGHKEIIELLIDRGADVNLMSDECPDIALVAAARGGHKEIIELLIDGGADVNLLSRGYGCYGNALAVAVERGHREIFKLLIDRGADVDLNGCALKAAVSRGDKKLIQLLIDKGANVNRLIQGDKHGSALETAVLCFDGEAEVIELLIDQGADVNLLLQAGEYGSALAAAATNEKYGLEIVQLLIDKGADVNLLLQVGRYGSALAAAATRRHKMGPKIVQLLIDKGADVNLLLQAGEYGSALAAAATLRQQTDPEIVQLLKDKGADFNLLLRAGEYSKAYAVARARKKIKYGIEFVQLLIDNGADVNQLLQAGEYGSALAAAASQGDWEILKLLLDRGADVNLLLQVGIYGSALAAAATNEEYGLEIVQLLIDKGVDVNLLLEVGRYGSALAAAATRERYGLEIVQLLVDRGADANLLLQTGLFGSALAAAAAIKNGLETVELLVDRGADANLLLQTGLFGSALAAAAANENGLETVELLVDRGADANLLLQTGLFGSALAAAAANKNGLETVELLIDKGVDANLLLQVGIYGSALAAAATNGGHGRAIVELLIDEGVDANLLLQSPYFDSALSAAAFLGRAETAQDLLKHQGHLSASSKQSLYSAALKAAQSVVSEDIRRKLFHDYFRDEDKFQEDRLEVRGLLERAIAGPMWDEMVLEETIQLRSY